MSFFRVVAGFAAVATLVQLALTTLMTAHFLTLDGNTLRIVAFVVGLVVALGIPIGGALGLVKALENRGRQPRRGPMIAGMLAVINGLAATALVYLVASPTSVLWSGGNRLLFTEAAAVEDTETTEGTETPENTDGKPEATPPPKGSNAVEASKTAVRAVLSGTEPEKLADALSNESAAALGTLWMGFLTDTFGDDLKSAAGPELWAAVHKDLPDQPDLWKDPAALETDLVPRGRAFLEAVMGVADSVSEGHGTGPFTWPVLPDSVLAEAVEGGTDLAWQAEYTEVAMNRVEVKIAEAGWNVRYEDHGWRVHIGDFGDLATRRISPRTMLIALRP